MASSLQSFNFPDRFVRHQLSLGELTPIVSELDKNDATFIMDRGLADNKLISFRSRNFPTRYLRHQDFRVKLHEGPPTFFGGPTPPESAEIKLLRADATFALVPGLADQGLVSFRSFNFPDRFLRHRGFHLFVEEVHDEVGFKDATFRIVPGFIPDEIVH